MSNARIVAVTTIVILTISLIGWIKPRQFSFDLREALPFFGGSREGTPLFDFAVLAVLLITCWGIWRLWHNRNH